MATKKIRNLTITATIPASDDYDVIDGEVNGTRKILASAREYVANKEQTTLDTSFTKYPCNNVVKNAVDLKANDNLVVHKDGTETISGVKTFSGPRIIILNNNNTYISGGNTTGTGTQNSAVGNNALASITTGNFDNAFGNNALYGLTTGSGNIAIGVNAGRYNSDGVSVNTTSENCIFLGFASKPKNNGDTNEVAIGQNTVGNGSNTATIGNTFVTDLYANQSGTATVHAGQVTCSPTLSSGTVAPTSTPAKIGDIYIDTVLKQTYVANDTTSSANWILQAGSVLEARHYVGQTGQPAFQNSWVNSGLNTPCSFYKDNFGIVHLEGYISSGTVGVAYGIFTLPTGYRPQTYSHFSTISSSGASLLEVSTAGRVSLSSGGNTWLSLNGISFRV